MVVCERMHIPDLTFTHSELNLDARTGTNSFNLLRMQSYFTVALASSATYTKRTRTRRPSVVAAIESGAQKRCDRMPPTVAERPLL